MLVYQGLNTTYLDLHDVLYNVRSHDLISEEEALTPVVVIAFDLLSHINDAVQVDSMSRWEDQPNKAGDQEQNCSQCVTNTPLQMGVITFVSKHTPRHVHIKCGFVLRSRGGLHKHVLI